MATQLSEIKSIISDELNEFSSYFKNALKSNVALFDRISYYIVQRKGKEMRPMFVFLSAKMLGQINEQTYSAATFIELLHTATLVHDDVVDESYTRRGFFSINALWKNKIAVLVGDFFLAKGMLLALDKEHYKVLHICSNAVKEMSEGELLQLEKARKLDIQEAIYFNIIRQKTASLIAPSCSAGAASTTENDEDIEKMRLFGEKLGIAFQIKDDLFDYGSHDIGKPVGIDIQEKKMTLPLIYTLDQVGWSDKRWIKNIVKRYNKDKKKVNELINFVREKGGLDYATQKMIQYRDEALEILHTYPESEARNALEAMVHFTIDRQK